MFVNEGDFEHCKTAIKNQKGVDVEHFIVEGLPEKQAHDTLFSKWNKVKNNFDLFVKVDADTVLVSENLISNVCELMYKDENVTGMQIPIHDYFTDSLIPGLNCFKPEVIFNTNTHELYCDRVDSGHKKEIKGDLVPRSLIPAANHCHYASIIQAFHFGLHRALKNQSHILQKVFDGYKKHQDELRFCVLKGAEASANFRDLKGFNYCDEKFNLIFNEFQKQLHQSVERT